MESGITASLFNRMYQKIIFTVFVLTILGLKAGSQNLTVTSPDKRITIKISNDEKLRYSVIYDHQPIVDPSPLGFEFEDEAPLGDEMAVEDYSERKVNITWRPIIKSKHDLVRDNFTEATIALVEKGGAMRRMKLFVRAYNDGVAFRYQLPGAAKIGERRITKELTGFNFKATAKAWVADHGSYTSPQELEFSPRALSTLNEKTVAGLPFLIETELHTYAAITEANIDNYPGFYIGAGGADTGNHANVLLNVKLSPLPGEKEQGIKARFDNSILTPWRVIMLAREPGKLIESEIIQNLNPPCAIKDVSWIKPGVSAWDNWWSSDVKMDMPTIKKYIDMASEQHWSYMLIDWQWYGPFNKPEADITRAAPQLNMPEILRYAKSKNVKCWLWLYSSDVNRNNNFERAFPLYQKWGIAGVKIDFMDRDDQQMVNWYRRIIQAAAKYHLMVDYHGAYKPDGIIRTYPNMITREGVLGEEYSKFSTRITPEHNTTLPFTRMLAGQMDYTPGGFLNVSKSKFRAGNPTSVMNSRCAELAKFVIYESPFTVYCDAPEHLLGQAGADFLKGIPTTWDDIKVLGGYPAEYVIIAKRSGDRWYIGAMTNSSQRVLKVKADFLSKENYVMTAWNDVQGSPERLNKTKSSVTAQSFITVSMDAAGGWAAILCPEKIHYTYKSVDDIKASAAESQQGVIH